MSLLMRDVSLTLGETPVLSHYSLELADGSRTALMGRSGIGKTTLLRLMAGLLLPDSGSVSGIPEGGAAVLFQENRLLPWFGVLDNLKIAVPAVSQERLKQLLVEVGLAGWENALPRELSGGMARRVALCRALAFPSPLLLLDEPFSGLDTDSREQAAAVIRAWSVGRTVAASVHDPEDARLLEAVILPVGPVKSSAQAQEKPLKALQAKN